MSINVTVTGNPIRINRGKMITVDPNHAKNEFEKRRLMRLEQVRQQSKNIAESVRNRVRKEKRKQIQKIEQEGKEKLRDWQNRKLLELQTQYKEALQEIGVGHKEAETLIDENEIAEGVKEQKQQISIQRGRDAESKLQIQKNREFLEKSIPIQRKKITRDIENSRAALVSGIKKQQEKYNNLTLSTDKKRKLTNINVTIPELDNGSLSTNDSLISPKDSFENQKNENSSSCLCSEDSDKPRLNNFHISISKDKPNLNGFHLNIPEDIGTTSYQNEFSNHQMSPIATVPSHFQETKRSNVPLDTRISDRIKRRNLIPPQPDFYENIKENFLPGDIPSVSKTHETGFQKLPVPDVNFRSYVLQNKDIQCSCDNYVASGQNLRSNFRISDKENIPITENNVHTCCCALHNITCPCLKITSKNKEEHKIISDDIQNNQFSDSYPPQEIPSKPHIKLKQKTNFEENKTNQITQTSFIPKETSKVQFYDHSNRFSGEMQIPVNSYVERISADSMEVIPNEISKAELQKNAENRQREAQIRGNKALRKERIQKDYEEMIKKLPILQRKERIAEIKKDKPQYHMSDERLKDAERKRQNDLDNAYNKLFPNLKPAIVTIPNKPQPMDVPMPDSSSEQFIDIAKWDVDYNEPKIFTAQEVQEIVKAFTGQNPSERRSKLKELLKRLKLHKEQLINEIKLLPKDDNINELIIDLNSVDSAEEMQPDINKKKNKIKSNRKKRRVDIEKDNSLDSNSLSSSSTDEYKRHQKGLDKKDLNNRDSEKSSQKKPRKKKSKQIIILQNTSTQTTPKIVSPTVENNKDNEKSEVKEKEKICSKLHIPCDCSLIDDESKDLCQIVIKLDNKECPKVVVKSKGKETSSSPLKKKEFRSVAIGTPVNSEQDLYQKVPQTTEQKVDKPSKSSKRDNIIKSTEVKSKLDSNTSKIDENKIKKTKSWKEQLSKNSISTSSTSYMSPPDFQKTKDKTDSDKLSFYNLRTKPRQTNIQDVKVIDSQKEPQDNIKYFIHKLLGMSRQSIENLNVSSTSSAPTPSQSVIENESNNPQSDLHNLLNYYANIGDIGEQLGYSPENGSIHYNTSASSSQKSLDKKNSDVLTDQVPEKDDSDNPKEAILKQYEHITNSCSKRIANLAAMIKQIRKEKVQMLQTVDPEEVRKCLCPSPVTSDKDFSTAYMDLPDVRESSSSKSSSSFDEEDMLNKLLEIDLNLAKKLRKMNERSPMSTEKHKKRDVKGRSRDVVDDSNDINEEIITRLERLSQQAIITSDPADKGNAELEEESTFVSFLSDIPKLPKFEPQIENGNNNHKKPPPSKGLIVARKFNDNISVVPHELSTIVEADSQLSARIPSPKSSLGSVKDIDVIILPNVKDNSGKRTNEVPKETLDNNLNKEKSKQSPLKNKDDDQLIECDDSTCPKLHGKSAKFDHTIADTSSSDDINSIEAMLRSIGMEWAIPTLHKTQEALALTSSSNSSSYSAKMKSGNDSNFSLKGFFHKQFLSTVSSSTFISDASPRSLLSEFSELSAIHTSSSSAEKNRKTSTPVTTSKSTSKSKDILLCSGASDISSVKKDSDNGSR